MTSMQRPLSPHLQVYRLPFTAMISITHRITGAVLAVGLLAMPIILLMIASGPAAYEQLQSIIGSFFGTIVLFAWSYALFFHLCHGIRHLCWDLGHGFEHQQLHRLALIELSVSVILTVLVWFVAA